MGVCSWQHETFRSEKIIRKVTAFFSGMRPSVVCARESEKEKREKNEEDGRVEKRRRGERRHSSFRVIRFLSPSRARKRFLSRGTFMKTRSPLFPFEGLPGFDREPQDTMVYPGQIAYLSCKLASAEQVTIQWLKDEQPLVLDESRMTILPSGKQCRGRPFCMK